MDFARSVMLRTFCCYDLLPSGMRLRVGPVWFNPVRVRGSSSPAPARHSRRSARGAARLRPTPEPEPPPSSTGAAPPRVTALGLNGDR